MIVLLLPPKAFLSSLVSTESRNGTKKVGKVSHRLVNPLHSNISMHILHTVLIYIF